jgi:hypothetical protein
MAEKAAAAVLDFTDTKDRNESGVNKKRVPAGDYIATVVRVEDRPTKETKEAQWMYVISLDSIRGTGYPYYCKLQANQLWKVRNLFLAGGLAIPKKKVRLDPNRVVGKKIAVTMEDDEYDGKLQSVIAEIFPPSELEDEANAGTETDEDDEEYDDEEDPQAEVDGEEEDAEDEEEEEEEPEPTPPPRRRTAAAKKAAPAKASIPRQRKAEPEVSDDELDELDLDEI